MIGCGRGESWGVNELNNRQKELSEIRKEYPDAYTIIGWLALVSLGIWIGFHIFTDKESFGANLLTELLGIGVTVFLLEKLMRQSDARRRKQELVDRLLYDARSTDPAISRRAFEDMKFYDLIYDENSILREANLRGAKPVKVDLNNAWLDGADLTLADFSQASFKDAKLDSAKLCFTNLNKADFRFASLKKADLMSAILIEANLCHADLEEANLENAAVLEDFTKIYVEYRFTPGEILDGTRSKEDYRQLILPDKTFATRQTNMLRFTNDHTKDFWRSKDPNNPASRSYYKELNRALEDAGVYEKSERS